MLGHMSLPAFIQQRPLSEPSYHRQCCASAAAVLYLNRRSAFTANGSIGAACLGSGSVLRGRFSRLSKPRPAYAGRGFDDDLLSHGETPHYHRRCIVSLLSSGRDQVVPTLYGRQAIQLLPRGLAAAANRVCDRIGIACSCRFSVCLSTYRLTAKLFGCYMVKPHGQLVLVSSTPHSAYTPNLSTS